MRQATFTSGFSLQENRMIRLRESGFGEHMKEYGSDLGATYFKGKKSVTDRTLGAVGGVANVILKGPDRLYRAAVGQPYDAPHGIFAHTRSDIGNLVSDVFRLRPLRAIGDAWSLATSDLPLDTINLFTGNNLDAGRRSTRAAVTRTMAA